MQGSYTQSEFFFAVQVLEAELAATALKFTSADAALADRSREIEVTPRAVALYHDSPIAHRLRPFTSRI